MSAAPGYAIAAEHYRYEPKTNTKAQGMQLSSAPRGMVLSAGTVEWKPGADQVGKHRVVLSGRDDEGAVVEQEFEIEVATSTLVAEDSVSPESGGTVVAANPRAGRMLGVGVQVPARALKSPTNLTVSQLDRAPSMPNAQGTVRPVRFGPSGLVFDTAARVSLPLPDGVAHSKARLNAYVYNPAGRWERARVLSVDLDNGMMTAEAQHFSIYAASQSGIDASATVARAADASACAGALFGQGSITSPLSEIELTSVNNLSAALRERFPDGTASLEDLLVLPELRGSLRAVQVFELMERHGDEEIAREHRIAVTTLHLPGDGSADVTHSDALGNVLAAKHYAQPLRELREIEQRLSGAATAIRFEKDEAGELGIALRVHFAYYPGDASLDPVSLDDLGLATVDSPARFATESAPIADVDCDGLRDGFDGTDDRLVAAIEAQPSTMSRAFASEPVLLSARVVRGEARASSWTVLDGGDAQLEPVPDAAHARRFKAAAPGRYLVSHRAELADRVLEHVFAIDVLAQPLVNTPPKCTVAKYVETGRVGEPVGLTAIASDAESASSSLRIEWGLVGGTPNQPQLMPASTLSSGGARALFAPPQAGIYNVGCRAFDGQAYGPVGALELSVVAQAQNRLPELSLSPLSTTIQSGDSLTFSAFAKDADGDPLTFAWQVEGARLAEPSTSGNESRLRVTGEGAEGSVATVSVSVTDGKSPPVLARAKLLINPPLGDVDADRDGWPAGSGRLFDCNDGDPRVHPTAKEVCGDRVDYDCDGSVRIDDCDYDEFTLAQGDCDDLNPNRHPGAMDLCDGLDNDCNDVVDDRFTVGARCVQGSGECQAFGVIECSADGLYALCAADSKLPREEVCDRVDNDCDGTVDEEGVCGGTAPDAGADAGVSDAGVPQRDAGSTTMPTDAGYDADTRFDAEAGYDAGTRFDAEAGYDAAGSYDAGPGYDADAGCIARPEVCDRIDNDCNGAIDEGLVCSCDPKAPEHCGNQVDDDCDGLIDAKDADCTQSCAPTAIEYCFDRVDNDCDGLIDAADFDCAGSCRVQGPELCQDGIDNDCDGKLDGDDSDCAAMEVGESCLNPHGIQLDEWNSAYLRGRSDDIESSCFKGGVDYVFRFDVKQAGPHRVLYEGGQPSAWSIMSGTCSTQSQKLVELACKEDVAPYLEVGTYFLVVEGTQDLGSFSVVVQPEKIYVRGAPL